MLAVRGQNWTIGAYVRQLGEKFFGTKTQYIYIADLCCVVGLCKYMGLSRHECIVFVLPIN